MRHWLLILLIASLLKGASVYAVDIFVEVVPDNGFYRPGEIVTLRITASTGSHVEARVTYLAAAVAEIGAPVVDGAAELTWQPPAEAPRGYGLELTLLDADGARLASASTAFDVLERWTQAPRYGFFSDFTPERASDEATTAWLLRHHINGVQFYDWQYRWEDLLPEGDMFTDGMGRPLSMATVTRLIDLLHAHGIAAMPYTAIYGASMAFYHQHPDWALVSATGELFTLADFIAIMDPTPGSPWSGHLLAEFADVLDHTAFDGIHIDQYGSPKVGFDAADNRVDLAEVMPQFIDQAAALVKERRGADGAVIFNAVGNWPVETVAPSNQNAVYIEVWSPYNDYLDLHRIVVNAREQGGGKPVIIAAYIPPERAINWRLANAVILASGGFYLQTGEPHALLADPYFPRYGTLNPNDEAMLRRYYDFMVRYENVLSLNTTAAAQERVDAVDLGEIRTRGIRSKDRIVPIVRAGDGFETFSLTNFLDIDASDWNQPTTVAPTALENLQVSIGVTRPVRQVWTASPDSADSVNAQAVPFAIEGGVLKFTLPRLAYWGMIVVEYAE